MATEPLRFLLFDWWKILQQFRHRFCQVFLPFLRLGLDIQGLGNRATPNQLLLRRVIHVQINLSDLDCLGGSGAEPTPATIPPTAPTWTVPPTAIEGRELLFLTERNLVADQEIGGIASRRDQALLGHFRIYGCLQLLIR